MKQLYKKEYHTNLNNRMNKKLTEILEGLKKHKRSKSFKKLNDMC